MSNDTHAVLNALAKRYNGFEKFKHLLDLEKTFLWRSNFSYPDIWYGISESFPSGKEKYVCLICGAYDQEINCDTVNSEHALVHLKEHNLLPFL